MSFIAYAQGQGILNSFEKLIPGGLGNIFNFGLQIGFAIAFGTTIYAGFIYMTAGDNPSKINDAKEWIKSAAKGILVLTCSYALLNFINPNLLLLTDINVKPLPPALSGNAPMIDPSRFLEAPSNISGVLPNIFGLVGTPGPLTSVTGLRLLDELSNTCSVHTGIDIGVNTGTEVFAAGSGKLTISSDPVYGNAIYITHKDGYKTLYAHLSNASMELQGQEVVAGQKIGLSGNTGMSTGPHLHFAVFKNDAPMQLQNIFANSPYGNALLVLAEQSRGPLFRCPQEYARYYGSIFPDNQNTDNRQDQSGPNP